MGRPALALGLAAVGGLWAILLNRAYARKLGRRGRALRRIEGDRAIAQQLVFSYLIPLGIALVLLTASWIGETDAGPLTPSELQGLVAILSFMLVAWLASSHTDWYYIRPRIDGVVIDPPCRTSRDTAWKGVTRKWYIHRAIASLMTMAALVASALIVTLALAREWPGALSEIGGFAAILGVGLWLMRDEIASVGPTSASIRTPRYWVGDDLLYETDGRTRRGYVLHVAIPVTKVVPLDRDSGAREADIPSCEVPATELHNAHCQPRRFTGCNGPDGSCQKMNPECIYGQPRQGQGKRHLLVI